MASSSSVKTGRLILYDALAAARRSVLLIADLLEEHFLRNSGLGGEVLLFQQEGRAIGQAMTGGDGRAVKQFRPTALGMTRISARVADIRRVTAPEAVARLFVWDRQRSLALIGLEALKSRSSRLLPIADGMKEIDAPDPQAVKILSDVAHRIALVYFIKVDAAVLADVREWLERYHLPPGPVLLVKDRGIGPELHRLSQEGWSGLKTGLVSTTEEAKALIAAGKVAIASPVASSREKWPERTVRPKDWEETGKRLGAP